MPRQPPEDGYSVSGAGSAYIYDRTSGDLLFTIENPSPETADLFGFSVSFDANTLIIGATGDNTGALDAGSAYIYQIDFTDADILYGGSGDDTLHGLFGDDQLFGQAGSDKLFGGEGSDRFIFESATVISGVDRIEDFDITDGDVIDISDILTGYTRGVSDINDFVLFTVSGPDTLMSIDIDGAVGGVNFQAAALIVGGAALTPATLETNGTLDGVV